MSAADRWVLMLLPLALVLATMLPLWAYAWIARRRALGRIARVQRPAVTTVLAAGVAEIVGDVLAEGDAPVVALTIRQDGRRHRRKHRRWIEWTEQHRGVASRAFAIHTAAGLVHVETPAIAVRVNELRVVVADLVRRSMASVVPGERVIASGRLVRASASSAYRGAVRWMLVPDGGRVIVSTATPDAPDRARLTHLGWIAQLALGSIAASVLLLLAGLMWQPLSDPASRALFCTSLCAPLAPFLALRSFAPWWMRARLDETTADEPRPSR